MFPIEYIVNIYLKNERCKLFPKVRENHSRNTHILGCGRVMQLFFHVSFSFFSGDCLKLVFLHRKTQSCDKIRRFYMFCTQSVRVYLTGRVLLFKSKNIFFQRHQNTIDFPFYVKFFMLRLSVLFLCYLCIRVWVFFFKLNWPNNGSRLTKSIKPPQCGRLSSRHPPLPMDPLLGWH